MQFSQSHNLKILVINKTRQVGFKTILALLKQKGIHFSIGMIFTLLPFAIGLIFLLITTLSDSGIPKADYKEIGDRGKLTVATITEIEVQGNITVNDEHPSIISYKYNNDDNDEVKGVYRSLNPDKIDRMDIGDSIQIKYLAGDSMIVGLEPFKFPFGMLYDILTPFFVIGIIFLSFLYFRIRIELDLYKNGSVMQAELVSMTPKTSSPFSSNGQGVTVHYQYKTTTGKRILGKSFTIDHSILNSKKQGDLLKIFVSETNESKSCLIPKTEQIRNNWEID